MPVAVVSPDVRGPGKRVVFTAAQLAARPKDSSGRFAGRVARSLASAREQLGEPDPRTPTFDSVVEDLSKRRDGEG